MEKIYIILLALALTAYSLSMVTAFINLFRPVKRSFEKSRTAIAAGFFCHLIAFVIRCLVAGTLAASSLHESLSFFALFLALVFLWLTRNRPLPTLAVFTSPLLIIFSLWALVTPHSITPQPPILNSFWLPLHVIFSFAGNAFLAIGCATAVMYLLQDRLIKKKKLGGLFRRLPPLQKVDELNDLCLRLGFPLLTLGIISGSVWASFAWGTHWSWDPKETWSLITWLLFAALLHGRMNSGWRGRRASWLTIIGFAALMFTFLGVNLLLTGLHGYAH